MNIAFHFVVIVNTFSTEKVISDSSSCKKKISIEKKGFKNEWTILEYKIIFKGIKEFKRGLENFVKIYFSWYCTSKKKNDVNVCQ